MSQVYEEDILGAGKDQVVISNDNVKVIIVPDLGGRIADVQSGETGFLYKTYPKGVDFGPYTEYGGLEECIGGAPGTLWNTRWKWEHKDDAVMLQSLSKRTLMRKLISVDEAEPIIKIEYSFFNLGDHISKFTFGIHPEVCIGGSLKDNMYHVPTDGEMLNGGYVEPGFKNVVVPSEGWCAITCEGKAFGQMFSEGVIDVIEIYYPRVDTHLVLEPIIFSVGISPEKCAGFTYMMYMGDGDAEKIKEMRAARDAEFSVKYEIFDKAEIPEELMAELGENVQEQDRGEVRVRVGREERIRTKIRPPEMPIIPQIPNIHIPNIPNIPNVGKIISDAIGQVTGAIGAVAGPKSVSKAKLEETGKIEDLPPDTEIVIEHLNGNITINGWEQPNIEYTDIRGTLNQEGNTVKITASGDYTLRVPRQTPRISLNFVNGNASVSDVASSLKVSGVNGKVDVVSAEVPGDGAIDVSLVKGDISLSIPGDSSCRISAAILGGGDINCKDLSVEEAVSERNHFSGVMNEGTAAVKLNTIKGNILIGQTAKGEEQ